MRSMEERHKCRLQRGNGARQASRKLAAAATRARVWAIGPPQRTSSKGIGFMRFSHSEAVFEPRYFSHVLVIIQQKNRHIGYGYGDAKG